jgi:putative transcriptional regulator
MIYNNKLKEFRLNKNISPSELAKEVGVSERYIRFIESGEKNPSLYIAKKIAMKLNAKIDDIFLV